MYVFAFDYVLGGFFFVVFVGFFKINFPRINAVMHIKITICKTKYKSIQGIPNT